MENILGWLGIDAGLVHKIRQHVSSHAVPLQSVEVPAVLSNVSGLLDVSYFASGSMCDVFRANYKGAQVACKVLRPNVKRQLDQEVSLLRMLSSFVPQCDGKQSFDFMVQSFTQELDLRNEFVNIQWLRSKMQHQRIRQFTTQIPEVMAHRQSYLIYKFSQGKPLSQINSEHEVKQEIAATLIDTYLFMLLQHKTVLGDCNAQNVLFDDATKQLTLIDHGSVIILSDECFADIIQTHLMKLDAADFLLERMNNRVPRDNIEKINNLFWLDDNALVEKLNANFMTNLTEVQNFKLLKEMTFIFRADVQLINTMHILGARQNFAKVSQYHADIIQSQSADQAS